MIVNELTGHNQKDKIQYEKERLIYRQRFQCFSYFFVQFKIELLQRTQLPE